MVLSDVGTGAAKRTGALAEVFVRQVLDDRAPLGAMRPEGICLGRKTFPLDFISGAAKLFTAVCGELLGALLASG